MNPFLKFLLASAMLVTSLLSTETISAHEDCWPTPEESKAVVRVNALGPVGQLIGHGTGTVIAPGWILTAGHVVDEEAIYTVWLGAPGEDVRMHSVIKTIRHPNYDLALIQVAETDGITPIPVAKVDPHVFQWLMATGYPRSYGKITTHGQLQVDVNINPKTGQRSYAVVQGAAPGMSGSALMTCKGELVGVLWGVVNGNWLSFSVERRAVWEFVNQNIPYSTLKDI